MKAVLLLLGFVLAVGPLYAAETHTTEVGPYLLTFTIDWISPHRATVRADVTIPASKERVWAVLTAYEQLAEFIPNLTYSHVVQRQNEYLLLHQKGNIWLPLYRRKAEVVLRVEESSAKDRVSFRALRDLRDFEGVHQDFVVYEGGWSVQKVAQGTLIFYQATVEPNFWIPNWALAELERQTLKMTFRALIRRCLPPNPE